jgi:hypothetical protein
MSLDSVPIWGVFVGTFLVVIISIEAGYALGHMANWRKVDEKESPTSAVAAAILGLVAFMLAFTFGIASDRFDRRRYAVNQRGNAQTGQYEIHTVKDYVDLPQFLVIVA